MGYKIVFKGRAETMAHVMGDDPISPAEMIKRMWAYVKQHHLVVDDDGQPHAKDCQCPECFVKIMRRMLGEEA